MYPRHAAGRLAEALSDTRVVLLAGPRQSGKTTLVRSFEAGGRRYLTLDNAATLEAAQRDPTGFIRDLEQATIDEVQRSPELLLAIKESVDADPRPGRFLLTGSSDLMTAPRVADSLAGRMTTISLLPLAQAELREQAPPAFLETLLAGRSPRGGGGGPYGRDLEAAVLAGGYPEALRRADWGRRQDWLLDYLDAIIRRDVRDMARVDQLDLMPRLLAVLAEHSAQLANYTGAGAAIGLNHVTAAKYARLFEQLFLTCTLPPWSSNQLSRLVKSPKLHFLDAGLLAALKGVTPDILARDRTPFGAILESFVVSEMMKLASWSNERLIFSHFRDKEGLEVDLLVEDRRSRLGGLEVKAAATVRGDDFKGLRRLRDVLGDRFAGGYVLYDGDQVLSFGDRLWAAPISCLWA